MSLIYYRDVVLQTILFIDHKEYLFQFQENRDVEIMEMIISTLKNVFDIEDPTMNEDASGAIIEEETAFKYIIKDNGCIEVAYVSIENIMELQKNRFYRIGHGHGVRFVVKMHDPVFAMITS